MTIYEIDQELRNLVDEETGEILDSDAFTSLVMDKEHKLEGMAMLVKEYSSIAESIKQEENRLAKRRQTAENNAKRLKEYLKAILQGSKFKTARCSVYYTTSHPTEILDEKCFIEWAKAHKPELLVFSEPTASRTEIKKRLESGEEIPYCKVGDNTSVVVR